MTLDTKFNGAFDGLRFLITGGSIGIGRQLAIDLSSGGAQVLVCARSANSLDRLRAEHPGIATQVCDITVENDVLALRDAAVEHFGTPDVLINNAALFQRLDLTDDGLSVEQWLSETEVNVQGTLRVTHTFLPLMRSADEATIVNLTSGLAYTPDAGAPLYSASKAAIASWTRSLRHQLRDTNVSVIELSPPVVDTRMNVNNPGSEGRKKWPTEEFSQTVLKSLARSRKRDILVGDGKLAKTMSRLAPKFLFKQMNPTSTKAAELRRPTGV
jgi:uncharacterized oxidoreductase